MRLDTLGLLATVGISWVLIACGPDCTSTCEQAQEDGDCLKEADGTGDIDCEKYCDALEEIADQKNGDCEDDFDEALSCVDDGDNACTAYEHDCNDEIDNFSDCVGDFCTAHPTNDACEAFLKAVTG